MLVYVGLGLGLGRAVGSVVVAVLVVVELPFEVLPQRMGVTPSPRRPIVKVLCCSRRPLHFNTFPRWWWWLMPIIDRLAPLSLAEFGVRVMFGHCVLRQQIER